MTIVLSITALLLVLGHLLAIVRDRYYWPFSPYPMYSYPVRNMSYPIIAGERLSAFSLEVVFRDGREEDILASAYIYPPLLHPLDRLEINILLLRAGLPGTQRKSAAVIVGRSQPTTASGTPTAESGLHDVLTRLGRMVADRAGAPVSSIRLVRLTWPDFRVTDANRVREVVMEVTL